MFSLDARRGNETQAKRPAALYPWKRKQWFEVAFADEPAVKAAAPFGAACSDYRRDDE